MRLAIGLVLISWVFSVLLRISVVLTLTYTYYPALGDCVITGGVAGSPLLYLLPGSEIVALFLIIITCVYLRHKILKSNKLFCKPKRNIAEDHKATRAGRLVEALEEQLKPTISVLIVGGIDGLFDIVIPIVFFATVFTNPAALEYAIEFVLFPLSILQMLGHVLTYGIYNKNIRKEICEYKEICSNHTKVISLNGNNNWL